MSDITGIIGTATNGSAPRAAVPVQPAQSVAQTSTQSLAIPTVQPLSPTLKFDPVADVMITEYYNSAGKIESQLPSTASIAYLRVGLTATGEPRKSPQQISAESTAKHENMLTA
jgi:hypothetical protein